MVKITKVYTRTGDQGMTSLSAGKRVKKTNLKIELIGTIDELNSYIGWARLAIGKQEHLEKFDLLCARIQHELFDLGAELSIPKSQRKEGMPCITEKDIAQLEKEIDKWNGELAVLNSFILPGGGEASARLHIARAVCRRAERDLVKVAAREKLDGVELAYLNRLSDWLFVAARFVAKLSEEPENLWQPGLRDALQK